MLLLTAPLHTAGADFHLTNCKCLFSLYQEIFNLLRTCALVLDLDLPRLISFESFSVGGSMCHGWHIERCQPGMAVCAALLVDHSQNAEGTLGLIGRKRLFASFLVFSTMKAPAEDVLLVSARQHTGRRGEFS